LGASSEFDQPSMIALGSSRTLEVSEPVVEGLPTIRELNGSLDATTFIEARRDCAG
jgi:hypothetical protein